MHSKKKWTGCEMCKSGLSLFSRAARRRRFSSNRPNETCRIILFEWNSIVKFDWFNNEWSWHDRYATISFLFIRNSGSLKGLGSSSGECVYVNLCVCVYLTNDAWSILLIRVALWNRWKVRWDAKNVRRMMARHCGWNRHSKRFEKKIE